MAVSLNEEASCPGAFYGTYLTTDGLDPQTEYIHVLVLVMLSVQAIVCVLVFDVGVEIRSI